jgi:tetratricopeptide (TPR) repeat protein
VLWRTELSRRRVLVVLDNAVSSAQVAPLLPTCAGAVALVTSRRRLLGLDGVRPRSLPLLDPAEAVELLSRVAGVERVAAEPASAAQVVRRCGYLPLAIRLAGARLAHRRGWRVTDLAQRLSTDRPLLPELAAEDRTVADAFGLSYTPLEPATRRMFRLLGLHPGDWLDERAAAALADVSLTEAGDRLAELVNRHLVEEPAAGRYRLHDLMREYAASLATADSEGVSEPLQRLLDYYLFAAVAAGREMETPFGRETLVVGDPHRVDLVAGAAEEGPAWLERERLDLTRLVRAANQRGLHRPAWEVARACFKFLFHGGYGDDIIETQQWAMASAEASGDRDGAAVSHNYLAAAFYRRGRFDNAVQHLLKTIFIQEAAGPPRSAAMSRANLAGVYGLQGRFGLALAESEMVLAVMRKSGDAAGLAHGLLTQGEVYRMSGRLHDALRAYRMHLAIAQELGGTHYVSVALGNLGIVRARLGHHGPATRLLNAALAIKRKNFNRYGEAEILNELAVLQRGQRRFRRPWRCIGRHCRGCGMWETGTPNASC